MSEKILNAVILFMACSSILLTVATASFMVWGDLVNSPAWLVVYGYGIYMNWVTSCCWLGVLTGLVMGRIKRID